MQVLRPNASGDDVQAWQLFLRGQEAYPGEVHGRYDDATIAATKAWQKAQGLLEDAVVGLKTYAKAQELGFNPGFDDPDESEAGPKFPPKPSFGPLNAAARAALFGTFAYRPAPGNDPEAIEITDGWDKRHIQTVDIPQLANVPGGKGGKVRLHELAIEPFRAFFAGVEKAGLLDRILQAGGGGTFYPRFIRGSTTSLSNHAYGSAIDINVEFNKLGVVPALKGKKGCVRELVPIANECGLYWGGHFPSRPDGMHFELARVKGK